MMGYERPTFNFELSTSNSGVGDDVILSGVATESTHVLLVDDDEDLSDLVEECLRREGMAVEVCRDGETGLKAAQTGKHDILILDVMLPGLGGFEVLRRIRGSSGPESKLPVLMLTARGDEVDRVLGFEVGADDYLPKPFSARELVARLRAILRRARPEPDGGEASVRVLKVGDLEIDTAARDARRGGERLELTGAEFELLDALLRSAGSVVTREAISEKALGRRLMPFDRSIDVHMSNLRRKLGPAPDGSERIKSIRGVGYIYARPAG
jgi:two-component system response regulator CpxR